MKKILSSLMIFLFLLAVTDVAQAKYIENDANLIWKDVNSKVYLPYSTKITKDDTLFLTRGHMSYWESDYGGYNIAEIVEIDLKTGQQLQQKNFEEAVYVQYFEDSGNLYIVVKYDNRVEFYDKKFNLLFKYNHPNDYRGFEVTIKNNLLQLTKYSWEDSTITNLSYDLPSFTYIGEEIVNKDEESKWMNAEIRDNVLFVGSEYGEELTIENASRRIYLGLLANSSSWRVSDDITLSYQNDAYIVTDDNNQHYIIKTAPYNEILASYVVSYDKFLLFNDVIIIHEQERGYLAIDRNTFEVVKVLGGSYDFSYNFGEVTGDYLVLPSKDGILFYDKNLEIVNVYTGDDLQISDLDVAEDYLYSYDKLINSKTNETVFYAPDRIQIINNYIIISKMRFGFDPLIKGDSYGSIRIYKIPENSKENIPVVPSNKVWKITLNQAVDANNQNLEGYFRVIQKSGEFSGYPKVEVKGNVVFVHPPKDGYKPGHYYLYIDSLLKSNRNDTLWNEVYKPFIVE